MPFSAFQSLDPIPGIEDYKLTSWNTGVFDLEFAGLKLIPSKAEAQRKASAGNEPLPLERVAEGTFLGTLMALSEIANRLDELYAFRFAARGIEQRFPIPRSVTLKRNLVAWDHTTYPPHCAVATIPQDDIVATDEIFDANALKMVTIFRSLVPNQKGNIIQWVYNSLQRPDAPEHVTSISQIQQLHNELRQNLPENAYADKSIGDREDWYSDSVFAGQQFVGTNPTTIAIAPPLLVAEFVQEAQRQSLQSVVDLLAEPEFRLFVQDYRYIREAAGIASDADIQVTGDGATRYGCAPVALFTLDANGVLHPLAVVIDYKQTISNSVVTFNKRLRASDSTASEAADWPWRYAKLCVQVADFTRHELEVHLTHTHLVEEVTIVATLRSFPDDHPIHRLLSPHWLRTLSLNASARAVLVPQIIVPLVGLTADQSIKFVNFGFNNFSWEDSYVPNDLKRRGFPSDEAGLDSKQYHNYAFARNIITMWDTIKSFVQKMLAISYSSDAAVASDPCIQTWCDEIRNDGLGQLKSFPAKIETFEALVNAITMCIHIATSQHTAVNYLQQYYMTFVPNKPAALYIPLPKSLGELQQVTEESVLNSWPVNRPADWLLSSHVPWLLSFRVEDKNSLLTYAKSLYEVYRYKKDPELVETAKAARSLHEGLQAFQERMKQVSNELDDQTIPYAVLNPAANAVSILI